MSATDPQVVTPDNIRQLFFSKKQRFSLWIRDAGFWAAIVGTVGVICVVTFYILPNWARHNYDLTPATAENFQITEADCPEGSHILISEVDADHRKAACVNKQGFEHGPTRKWVDGHPYERAERREALMVGTRVLYEPSGEVGTIERHLQSGCMYEQIVLQGWLFPRVTRNPCRNDFSILPF